MERNEGLADVPLKAAERRQAGRGHFETFARQGVGNQECQRNPKADMAAAAESVTFVIPAI